MSQATAAFSNTLFNHLWRLVKVRLDQRRAKGRKGDTKNPLGKQRVRRSASSIRGRQNIPIQHTFVSVGALKAGLRKHKGETRSNQTRRTQKTHKANAYKTNHQHKQTSEQQHACKKRTDSTNKTRNKMLSTQTQTKETKQNNRAIQNKELRQTMPDKQFRGACPVLRSCLASYARAVPGLLVYVYVFDLFVLLFCWRVARWD